MIYKLFFLCLLAVSIFADSKDQIYGNIPKEKYLMGDFTADKNLKLFTNPDKSTFYLREDVIVSLEKMIENYEEDRALYNQSTKSKKAPPISVRSAFRNYTDQKAIWEAKFKGERKMRESVEGKTPEQKIALILEYSSAPGTSRHHWGTDMDLNNLTNDYFGAGNEGEFLYKWLKQNAHHYGFCQPYNEYPKRDNKGYFEEKWHWSYAPVSNRLTADWVESYNKKLISYKGKFLGSDFLKEEQPLTYVTSINQDCKKHLEKE